MDNSGVLQAKAPHDLFRLLIFNTTIFQGQDSPLGILSASGLGCGDYEVA